jgi:hypothetical protein
VSAFIQMNTDRNRDGKIMSGKRQKQHEINDIIHFSSMNVHVFVFTNSKSSPVLGDD